MRKRQQQKQGHLGPAFHEWLEWLEYAEALVLDKKMTGKPKHMALNDTLFKVKDDADFTLMMNDALPVDAWLARCVRSSVKYKVDAETFAGLVHHYEDELRYIRKTTPINLPHEWCTLMVEWGDDTYLISLQETTTKTGERYPELDVDGDEPWICANLCLHRTRGVELMADGQVHSEQRLSYVPVELHFQKGKVWEDTGFVTATTPGVVVTKKGQDAINIFRAFILIWLEQFQLQSVLRHKTIAGGRPPMSYRPKRLRKRHQHPQFEHTIIQLEVDAPEPSQTGRSIFQPHKRLHQVRGFYRHYKKSGKKVWVKPHWRGDESLGVVRRDIELITHEEHASG
jgi:hypothetical protein